MTMEIAEPVTIKESSGRALAVEWVHHKTAIYTTLPVVDGLLDRLGWPTSAGRLLDPSCGDGAFLLRALGRVAPTPGDFEAATRVCGYEFHPGAVAEARARVMDFLVASGWGRNQAEMASQNIVIERDFLLDAPAPGMFDFIAGNPPYLRFARLPEYFKATYGARIEKYALGDLLHCFIARVSNMLAENGAIGIICSDRWLMNETAGELRTRIGGFVGLSYVARLDPETSFYRPKVRVKGSLPRVHPVEIILHPARSAPVPITRAPISPDGYDLTPSTGPTLGDVAQVRVTPWLGPAGIFVINRQVAETLVGADLVPAVDTDDINPHTDELGTPKRFAILTSRLTEPTGAVRDHLLATCSRMPERGRQGPYWTPPEQVYAGLDRPSLLIPRIARRLRVIDLPPHILGINHNLSVIESSGDFSLSEIKAILLSSESQDWIARHAPRVDSGYYSITTKLLRRLPVPARFLESHVWPAGQAA